MNIRYRSVLEREGAFGGGIALGRKIRSGDTLGVGKELARQHSVAFGVYQIANRENPGSYDAFAVKRVLGRIANVAGRIFGDRDYVKNDKGGQQ